MTPFGTEAHFSSLLLQSPSGPPQYLRIGGRALPKTSFRKRSHRLKKNREGPGYRGRGPEPPDPGGKGALPPRRAGRFQSIETRPGAPGGPAPDRRDRASRDD